MYIIRKRTKLFMWEHRKTSFYIHSMSKNLGWIIVLVGSRWMECLRLVHCREIQKAVFAYSTSERILPFRFADQYRRMQGRHINNNIHGRVVKTRSRQWMAHTCPVCPHARARFFVKPSILGKTINITKTGLCLLRLTVEATKTIYM